MKQFLRYEISGLVFTIWFLLFYNIDSSMSLKEIVEVINNIALSRDALSFIVFALPIGTIIHQLSVIIKNCLIGLKCTELNDFPKPYLKEIDYSKERSKYLLERISNLNSFYYVRFDNGLLAPLLALIINIFLFGFNINKGLLTISSIIAVSLLMYIPRIVKEIKEYEDMLNQVEK